MKPTTQRGCLIQTGDTWRLRHRINGVHKSELVGTLKQYPDRERAQRAADRLLKQYTAPKGSTTIADLIDRYEKECRARNASTEHVHRSFCARIRKEWGHIPLESFASHLAAIGTWLNDLKLLDRKTGRITNKDASPVYKRQMKTMLGQLLDKAMLWQILPIYRNPMELVTIADPCERQKEIVTLSPAEYRALLEDPELPLLVKTMIQVTAGLGLRISEVLGLKWEDVDLVEKTVKIQRSVVKGVADKTKTSSSKAELPLHDSLCRALMNWRMAEPIVNGWVFGSPHTGMPWDRDHLRDVHLIPAGERMGLKIGWHTMRHSHRAWLRETGASLEAQKDSLRHAKIATTIDVYGGREKAEALRPVNAAVMNLLIEARS